MNPWQTLRVSKPALWRDSSITSNSLLCVPSVFFLLSSIHRVPRQQPTLKMADAPPALTSTSPDKYPLTTVWTGPSGCSTIIRTNGPDECHPPEFTDLWSSGHGYYSPGICPESYSIGCTAHTLGSVANGNPIYSSETVGFCVPRYVVHSLPLIW